VTASSDLMAWARQERRARGLSQTVLGAAIGVSKTAMIHLENGQRRLLWDEGWALVAALTTPREPSLPPVPQLPEVLQ